MEMPSANDSHVPSESLAQAPLLPVGVLFAKTWERFTKRLSLYLSIMAIPVLISLIVFVLSSTTDAGFGSALVGLILVVLVIVQLLSTIALTYAALASEQITLEVAYKKGLELFFPYLLITILTAVAIIGGLIILIIPGLIALVWFAFAPYILISENERGFEALSRSRNYVKGRWFPVAGRLFALIGVFFIAALVLGLLAAGFSNSTEPTFFDSLIEIFFMLFGTPFMISYLAVLYGNVKESTVSPSVSGPAAS